MSRTLSAAYSPFRASNRRCDFPSIPNALTTATPVTCSCRKAFIRASFRRISRFASRIRFLSSSTNSDEDGQDGEGDERKAQVHPEQDRGRARQHRDVADRRDEAGGEELLERLDVGGKARHQAPGRRAVEEDDGEPLHPREHLPAQREDHPLAEDRHRVHLQVEEPHRARRGSRDRGGPIPPSRKGARSSRAGR